VATYFVVNASITDPDLLVEYSKATRPSIQKYGAKVLAATNEAETLEGTSIGPRVVILEFAHRDAFDTWYNSPEYQDVIGMRFAATSGTGLVVEGR
jgi:uncharacterized protein (DUF1330 family)